MLSVWIYTQDESSCTLFWKLHYKSTFVQNEYISNKYLKCINHVLDTDHYLHELLIILNWLIFSGWCGCRNEYLKHIKEWESSLIRLQHVGEITHSTCQAFIQTVWRVWCSCSLWELRIKNKVCKSMGTMEVFLITC